MAKKNFYAVKKGLTPGIYKTWAECQIQINGVPGADYKGFSTEEEAKAYMGEVVINTTPVDVVTNDSIDAFLKDMDDETLVAFVDGSYSNASELYGYGIVFLNKDGVEKTLFGSDDNEKYKDSRNVAGEIEGVKNAITHALVQEYKKIVIFYDYEGIEKWANKSWAAKKDVSKDYIQFIENMKYSLEIVFKKVPAHSGITYNEQADQLAKKSLLQKGIKTKTEGVLSVSGIEESEFKDIFEILKDINNKIEVSPKPKFGNQMVYVVTLDNQKIVVTLFESGNTLIQGKQSTLLEMFTTLIVELLPNDREVVELLNTYNYHSIAVPKNDIDAAFVTLLPDFDVSKSEDQTLINTLKTAVYNTLIDGERPDYTDLITPVFRALEYYLYDILINVGIIDKYDGKHGFNCFDTEDKITYFLQKGHQKVFESKPEQLTYVNHLYNLYHNYRNVYSHWDKTGMTSTIDSLHDARIKIKEHLKDFNEYYIIF
ncbi:viroplasmin family protein [Lysinibacillus fusiformis]|uniref:ribonuclease H1 domain-containing protein n=1 Tax=Lysinibacillus fusiformis TaxID=28031 RepID=UPI003D058129